MGEHAILPPSSAKEWGNCGGWLTLNEGLETHETDEAKWGNAAHEVAAPWLERCTTGDVTPPASGDDDEMLQTVEVYVEHCLDLMRKCRVFGGPHLGIERRLQTSIHEQVWGTTDFHLYHEAKKTLYIRDFKTGRLIVDPLDEQLLCYMDGVVNELGLSDLDLVVDLGVVQPRGYHRDGPIRNVRMWAHELRGELNRLRNKAGENIARTGKPEAGEHCYRCDARFRCPAAIESAERLAYAVTEAVPVELLPSELGLLLTRTKRSIKFLEQMQKAYEGEVEGTLQSGQVVPGWALGTAYARSESWTVDDEQVVMLGQMFGKDLLKPPALVTPAQARQKGIPKEVISGYCTKVKTGVKLIESNDVSKIFGAKEHD